MALILIISTFLIVVCLLLMQSEKEKKTLSFERVVLKSEKIKKDRKIVFITDLHDHEFSKDNIELINAIKNEKPDLILIGGDIITTKRNKTCFQVLDNLLKNLKDVCPIIYANGNHEQRLYYDYEQKGNYIKYQEPFLSVLKNNDVIYLSDSKIDFDELSIYGLNLERKYYKGFVRKKLPEKYFVEKMGPLNKNQINILLGHTPRYLDEYEKWGIDLGLHGHFHGGVLRIGKQGVLTSEWQLFHKWCVGQFKINQSLFVVSRGLGGHTIDVRLHNLPEITVINLQKVD